MPYLTIFHLFLFFAEPQYSSSHTKRYPSWTPTVISWTIYEKICNIRQTVPNLWQVNLDDFDFMTLLSFMYTWWVKFGNMHDAIRLVKFSCWLMAFANIMIFAIVNCCLSSVILPFLLNESVLIDWPNCFMTVVVGVLAFSHLITFCYWASYRAWPELDSLVWILWYRFLR